MSTFWNPVVSTFSDDVVNLLACSSDGTIVYATISSDTGGVYKSLDSGVTFELFSTAFDTTQALYLQCSPDGTKYMCAYLDLANIAYNILYFNGTDSSTSTFLFTTFSLSGFFMSYSNTPTLFVSGSTGGNGYAAYSTNNSTWTAFDPVVTPTGLDYVKIVASSNISTTLGQIYLVSGATLYYSTGINGPYATAALGFSPTALTCSSDTGQYVYMFYVSGANQILVKSSASGSSLAQVTLNGLSNVTITQNQLITSSDGSRIVVINNASIYSQEGIDGPGGVYNFSLMTGGNDGNFIALVGTPTLSPMYSTIDVVDGLYSGTGAFPACFLENTIIQTENSQKYIQDLRPNDLVLTNKGFMKVLKVVSSLGYDNDLFYYIPKGEFNLEDDLVLTKYHSILIPEKLNLMDFVNSKYYRECYDLIHKIPGYNKLHICHMKIAKPLNSQKTLRYWHLILESEDEKSDYGVFANGVLCESCSKSNADLYFKDSFGSTDQSVENLIC